MKKTILMKGNFDSETYQIIFKCFRTEEEHFSGIRNNKGLSSAIKQSFNSQQAALASLALDKEEEDHEEGWQCQNCKIPTQGELCPHCGALR